MAQAKIDDAKITAAAQFLVTALNKDLLEKTDALAKKLVPDRGTNDVIDDAIEGCKTFQTKYNEFLKGLGKFREELMAIPELAAKVNAMSVNSVKNRETAYKVEQMDVNSVVR